MTPVTLLNGLEVVAAVAAFFAAALVAKVAFARRTIHFWINVFSAMWLTATGCEFLVRAAMPATPTLSSAEIVARGVTACAMMAVAALVVPFSNRIRRTKGYDALHRATEELQNADRLFDSFMNALPWPSFIKDRSGRLVYVNDHCQQITGRSKEEMLGTRIQDWVPPDQAAIVTARDESVFATQGKQQFASATTSTGVVSLFSLPMRDGQPYLGGIISTTSDQLQLEVMHNMLASIVEFSTDAIYTISPEKQITSWNRGAEEIFGYRCEEIIGRPLATIMPADRLDESPKWRQLIDSGDQVVDFPTVRLAKDGTHKHVLVSACKIRSLKGVGYEYCGITSDITTIKQAEQQLRDLNEQLRLRAEELVRANEALETARDEALAASNMKSAFVANVSHELRTPLSGVLGLSELLLQQPLQDDTRATIRTVHESALALLSIVNDILDLSKLEAGTISLNLQPFSAAEVVKDCVSLLAPAARSKALNLIYSVSADTPELLYGDASRLRQVLLNLTGNAVKFTTSGTVSIVTEVLSKSEQQVIIKFSVTDSGIGIDEEDRSSLFSPFSRIEKSAKALVGTGLGLVISKRLIDLMGGDINFISRRNQGSTFWFSLPLGTVPQGIKHLSPLVTAMSKAPELLSRHRILIVEDNLVLSELVVRQLTFLGARPDRAVNGSDALTAHARAAYDIILLDIHLPDISGHEVAQKIRNSEGEGAENPAVIIAMTAGAMPGDREKALASGMNDYMAKPVNLAQLSEIVISWAAMIESRQAINCAPLDKSAGSL